MIHNFQLLGDRARRARTASSPRSSTPRTRTSRRSPPGGEPARGAAARSRARSSRPSTTLRKAERAGRASSARRSSGCGPSRARSARRCAARAVPARDHADHPRPAAPVRARRAADRARPAPRDRRTWRVVTPRLTRTFRVLNTLFNTLAYNPPGARRASCSGPPGPPTPARRSSAPGRARADPARPRARRLPDLGVLEQIVASPTRSSACSTAARSTCRPSSRDLPEQRRRTTARHDQAGPQRRPDPRDGRVRAVVLRHPALPVADLRRLGAAAARRATGSRSKFPEATQLAQEADVRISGVQRRARSKRRSRTSRPA